MLFPFARWLQLDATQERVDRLVARRPYRLLAGVHLAPLAGAIQAALVVANGRGKFLTIKHVEFHSEPIPAGLQRELLRNDCEAARSAEDIRALAGDVTDLAAVAVESLKRRAGRFVDRILAATCTEPAPVLNAPTQARWVPEQLAELTGLNVIDALAERDRQAGGRGHPLAGWPLWLWLADRSHPISHQWKAVVLIDDWCETFLLPASDGLDAVAPAILWSGICVQPLLRAAHDNIGSGMPCPFREIAQLGANGRARQAWLAAWHAAADSERGLLPADELQHPADFVRTLVVFLAQRAAAALALLPPPHRDAGLQITVGGDSPLAPLVMNELSQTLGGSDLPLQRACLASMSCDHAAARALVAAVLGGLFIDQFPGNLPSLTGAGSLRCLGRVTPGTPSRWRELLTTMADQVPTPMKLRDAI